MNAHVPAVMNSTFVSPWIVERAMDWEEGKLGAVGWLVIQEMAQGVSLESVSRGLGVDVETLVALVEGVTGKEGDAAIQEWNNAVVALKAALMANAQQVSHGWDSVEAMAVEKLGRSLSEMKTNGDPMKMLAIATQANKAIRRSTGEGQGSSVRIGVNAGKEAEMAIELKAGALGSMRLSLSPRIQAQLGDPNRIIEAVAVKRDAGKLPLTMIGLKETRQVADAQILSQKSELDTPEPEPAHTQFDLTMFQEPSLDE